MSDAAPLPPIRPDFGAAGPALAKRLNEAASKIGFGGQMKTVAEVCEFVRVAHAGQVDQLNRDYFTHHLVPIAAKLKQHGVEAEMAGLLHDVLEDTPVTAHSSSASLASPRSSCALWNR